MSLKASYRQLAGGVVALLVLASPVLAGQLPIEPDPTRWRQTRSIIDFMKTYGQPDSIEGVRNLRIYHWKRIASVAFSDGETVSHQEFACDVRVKVAVDGPILQVKADVANPGALAIASAGGFGTSCARTFGLKSSNGSRSAERMKR